MKTPWAQLLIRVGAYLALFYLALLIFDSLTLLLGVGVAVYALYFFSTRKDSRDKL